MKEQLEQILKEVRELRKGMDGMIEKTEEMTEFLKGSTRRIESRIKETTRQFETKMADDGYDEFDELKNRIQKMMTTFTGEFDEDFDRIERRIRSASEKARMEAKLSNTYVVYEDGDGDIVREYPDGHIEKTKNAGSS